MRVRQLIAVAALCVAACSCGKGGAAAGDGPAGKVERVEGTVTATRAAAGAEPRPLAVADPVFADDTIATGEASAVDIRLAHNGALWQLGAGASRRVDSSAAWRAERGGAGAFARTDVDRTAAAGRHAERETMATRSEESEPVDGERVERGVDDALKKGGPGAGLGMFGGDDGTIGHAIGGGEGSGHGAGTGSGRGGGGGRGLRSPSVVIGDGEIEGALDASTVRRVLRRRRAAIRRCYEHELNKDASFTADVAVSFTIAPSGLLSPITVTGVPAGNDTLEPCLKAAVRAVRMPAADAETSARFRLTLRAR